MGLANSTWSLLRYKLRYVGWRNTLRIAYLDWSEHVFHQVAKQFPSVNLSPRSIQIECTTRCNLKCTFCEISYWTEKPADLKFENVQQMVTHLPKLQRIDLTGIGEALMNPAFFEIVKFLKARNLYVTLNDNFTLVTEQTAYRLVELGVDQIFLSLDGATKDTYEQLRRGSNFERVIMNTRRLIEIKQKLGQKLPEVKINTVVCLTNYHELPALVELAANMGVGMIQFVNVITFENTTDLSTQSLQAKVQQTFQDAVQRGRELGVLVKIELFDQLPVQQCDFPWTRNFVTHDGYVHPCCYTTQNGDRQAQNQRSLGNLLTHSFNNIWQNHDYSTFRQKMASGILPYQCQHCPKYTGQLDASSAREFV
jgi:radical SAM protein with 4Fe4S-binding SPASM domain